MLWNRCRGIILPHVVTIAVVVTVTKSLLELVPSWLTSIVSSGHSATMRSPVQFKISVLLAWDLFSI